ncbi:hypothetical protein RA210_U170039 [Rubrivivax sp. A210]|nr:hypothetical protein RA210_U170039 [Rubrivivax sp. A210]
MRRKISSPSRPASQAFTMAPTSLRLTSLTTALSRVLALSMGATSKCGGTTGRWAKLHLPRLTSYSSGALISTRWPTAEVTTKSSFSKCSACFSNLPLLGVSARTMSCATLGFSAMMIVLLMVPFAPCARAWCARRCLQSARLARTHARSYDLNVPNEQDRASRCPQTVGRIRHPGPGRQG